MATVRTDICIPIAEYYESVFELLEMPFRWQKWEINGSGDNISISKAYAIMLNKYWPRSAARLVRDGYAFREHVVLHEESKSRHDSEFDHTRYFILYKPSQHPGPVTSCMLTISSNLISN
jgi:hypothetical protein